MNYWPLKVVIKSKQKVDRGKIKKDLEKQKIESQQ